MILLAIAALRTLTVSYPGRGVECAISAAILLAAALSRNLTRPPLAVFGFGGIALIAAIQFLTGSTVYRYDTFGSILYWASLAAACWIAPPKRWLTLVLAFAACVAVTILIPPLPDLVGPFQSRNNAASFLLLFLPLALHRAFSRTQLDLIPLALATLLVAALFATGSRAGAALAVLETAGLLLLCRPPRQAVLATLGVLAAALATAGALFARFHEATLGFRPEILASTFHMFRDRPLFGFGLGTFESVYPAYATFDTGLVVNYAHNDWAQLGAEGGVPAATCFGLLLIAALRVLRAQPWSIGLIAVLLHALVDYPFARAGVALWFAILLGIATRDEAGS